MFDHADKKVFGKSECNPSKITGTFSAPSAPSTPAMASQEPGHGSVPFYYLFMIDGFGAVFVHRQLRDHWISTDGNTLKVFIQILLRVEWKEGKTVFFNGVEVKLQPGEMTFGRQQMAYWSHLSPKQVRISINKLKMAQTVAIKSTNKFSILYLNNWEKYQNLASKRASKRADEGPIEGRRGATLEEDKNIRNKEINGFFGLSDGQIQDIRAMIAQTMGHALMSEANSVCFREITEKMAKKKNIKRPYAYLLAAARKLKGEKNG